MSASRFILLALSAGVLTVPAAAQSDDTSGFDLTGSLGITAGLGWHPGVAVTAGFPRTPHLVPYLELGYTPLGNKAFRRDVNSPGLVTRSYLIDANGGLQVRFPLSRAFAPYFLAGVGLLHSRSEISPGEHITPFNRSSNDAAFVVGGGLRYYLSRRWGLRPEVKAYVSDRKFTRVSLGIFYTFP